MMAWTDRFCRRWHRICAPQALLYTEMVSTDALIHGPRARLLKHTPQEYPLALQLGGSNANDLAYCAQLAQEAGFQEVNLNVGCPSPRVQRGQFGAALMAHPDRVAAGVAAMTAAVDLPITVKCRLGIDDLDSYDFLCTFTEAVAKAGAKTLIVHARKALLKGLNPAQNRSIPPLHYERVYRLKQDFPSLPIVINGGIQDLDAVRAHLSQVDGVMLGRVAYQQPWTLHLVHQALFAPATQVSSRTALMQQYLPFVQDELTQGTPLHSITRHLLGAFNGMPGARAFRRYLSEHDKSPEATLEVLSHAISMVRTDAPLAA